jgi:hypothetical protein
MAELAHGTQPEFWRPPNPSIETEAAVRESLPAMAEVCPGCDTEFLLGSRFCHSCGSKRPDALSAEPQSDAAAIAKLWENTVAVFGAGFALIPWRKLKFPASLRPWWLHYFHFDTIKERMGLSTGYLVAFVAGLACVAGALAVGLLSAKTLADWQAIQFYRAEWLLGATASFVAGILLKKSSPKDSN